MGAKIISKSASMRVLDQLAYNVISLLPGILGGDGPRRPRRDEVAQEDRYRLLFGARNGPQSFLRSHG